MPEPQSVSQELFDRIPTDGSTIGNKSLREDLGWSEEKYLEARRPLLADGKISLGRGKGGSVRRITDLDETCENEHDAPVADPYPDERSLYADLISTIEARWIRDFNPTNWRVVDTSQGGRRPDGTWSRPDITVAAKSTYSIVPGSHFDVVTFEVKHHAGVNLTAVYEALAHRRKATRSFVLIYVPDARQDDMKDVLGEIEEETARHGIGLIVCGDPKDYETWTTPTEAVRVEPDPKRLNDFLSEQFKANDKEELNRWFR